VLFAFDDAWPGDQKQVAGTDLNIANFEGRNQRKPFTTEYAENTESKSATKNFLLLFSACSMISVVKLFFIYLRATFRDGETFPQQPFVWLHAASIHARTLPQ
jgi:hypothetical protein